MTSIRTGCGWSSGTMFPAGMASCINSSSVLVGRFSKLSKSKPESTSYLEAAAGSEVSSGADVVRDHIYIGTRMCQLHERHYFNPCALSNWSVHDERALCAAPFNIGFILDCRSVLLLRYTGVACPMLPVTTTIAFKSLSVAWSDWLLALNGHRDMVNQWSWKWIGCIWLSLLIQWQISLWRRANDRNVRLILQ